MNWSRVGRGMGHGTWDMGTGKLQWFWNWVKTGSGLKQDNRVLELMVGGLKCCILAYG
jgi:hypothetical protein